MLGILETVIGRLRSEGRFIFYRTFKKLCLEIDISLKDEYFFKL